MAINPENIDTVTLPELDTLSLQLNNFIAHSGVNGRLGKATLQSFATFIAPFVTAVGGTGFVPITSNALPDPVNNPAYSIVPSGTYTQPGESSLILTSDFNIINWNGTTWSLASGINIDLSGYIKQWEFVKKSETYVDIAEAKGGLNGYIRVVGQGIRVFNKNGGFYTLNEFNIDFGVDKHLFYLSSTPTTYTPLSEEENDHGECYVLTGLFNLDIGDKVILGSAFQSFGWSSIYNVFSVTDYKLDFYVSPEFPSLISTVRNEDKSITIKVTSNVPVFIKDTKKVFFIKSGNYTILNGKYAIFFWEPEPGGGTFSFNEATPNLTQLSISSIDYYSFSKDYDSILGINWQGTFFTEHQALQKITALEVINFSDYVPSLAIKNYIKDFTDKLNLIDDSFNPLNILFVGNSITNFQNSGPVKSNRTVEPQCLYGNTFARWIWRRLNFTYNAKDQDQVAVPFQDTKSAEWGNMRYLRVDHADAVKSSEFIPHGTLADGRRVWWHQRQNINGLTTALGGFRLPTDDAGTITTSIGEVKLHNHTYFFNKTQGSYVEFSVPANAKGFSVVFWGDDIAAPFPTLPGDTWNYVCDNVDVKVNGATVGTINQTEHRGQTRIDFPLIGSGVKTIRITHNSSIPNRVLNLWGIEYWVGKSVRVINVAAAGNQASAFYNNPDYMINKNCDLIVWETTTLNNVGGFSQVAEHKALGNLLLAKSAPILATTVHPIVEGTGGVTNYPDGSGTYQHVDAFAAEKALFELEIPMIDAFGAFKAIAIPLQYAGDYNSYFIDGTHLSDKGESIYSDLFDRVLSWKYTIK